MKAVVVGGSGFLGSHIADALTESGWQVTIFDRQPSDYLMAEQKFIEGNILDQKAVESAFLGQDVVYNFAGQADIRDALEQPVSALEQNIIGCARQLEAERVASIKRFIFASSVYVYSQSGGIYRVSKQACELLVEEYHRIYGLSSYC